MRSLFFCLTVAALIGCGGGSSNTTTASDTSNTQNSGGEAPQTLTLAQFTAGISQAALPDVCGNPQAFTRRCFTVDERTCGEAFQAAMQACSEQPDLQLPQTVTEQNAEATAQVLAQCAGQAYGIGLSQVGLMMQTPECQPNTAN